MSIRTLVLAAAAAAAVVAFAAPETQAAPRPRQVRLESAADIGAAGRLVATIQKATKRRAERTVLRFQAQRLAANATYSMWVRDAEEIDRHLGIFLTATRKRTGQYAWDTKSGTLPLEATSLADLAGASFRLKDANGVVVLSGPFPTAP